MSQKDGQRAKNGPGVPRYKTREYGSNKRSRMLCLVYPKVFVLEHVKIRAVRAIIHVWIKKIVM